MIWRNCGAISAYLLLGGCQGFNVPYFVGIGVLVPGKWWPLKIPICKKNNDTDFIIHRYKCCKQFYIICIATLLFCFYSVKPLKCSQLRSLYFVPKGISLSHWY
jgi:hypothetical protein